MKQHVTTVGSITLDIFVRTRDAQVVRNTGDVRRQKLVAFEYGAKIEASSQSIGCGGAAANTAVTFSRFGLNTRMIGAVGNDLFASFVLSQLRKHGVTTAAVQRLSMATSSSVIVEIEPEHAHYILVFRGASAHLRISRRLASTIRTPWLYIATLAGNWRENLNALYENARRKDQVVAWNPGSAQLSLGARTLQKYLKATRILIVNHDEAIELMVKSGKRVRKASSAQLARSLRTYGPKIVVVTQGHNGSVAFDGSRVIHQPAKKVRIVNKTGAGDAFGSGLVAGLIRYQNLTKAMRLGALNSASVVGQYGAQTGILSRRDILL